MYWKHMETWWNAHRKIIFGQTFVSPPFKTKQGEYTYKRRTAKLLSFKISGSIFEETIGVIYRRIAWPLPTQVAGISTISFKILRLKRAMYPLFVVIILSYTLSHSRVTIFPTSVSYKTWPRQVAILRSENSEEQICNFKIQQSDRKTGNSHRANQPANRQLGE